MDACKADVYSMRKLDEGVPLKGANSFTEGQAKDRAIAHGVESVVDLKKEDDEIAGSARPWWATKRPIFEPQTAKGAPRRKADCAKAVTRPYSTSLFDGIGFSYLEKFGPRCKPGWLFRPPIRRTTQLTDSLSSVSLATSMNQMSVWSPAADPPASEEVDASARRYVIGVFATILVAMVGFAVALAMLDRAGTLPPPPLTANVCIDEKFKFLADNDVRGTDLLAVGSSVTWRNLDMTAFKKSGLAKRPLNAAPCYLHISETVSYTSFLLKQMSNVRTVVTVVASRDFEQCSAPREHFFSEALAAAYVFDGLPSFPIYLANFKPHKFLADVLRIKQMRMDSPYRLPFGHG
jgi:hypothetical protein